ncbi:hypothetical protein DYL61_16400 [Pseudomonas nabeulensis]|uniref:Uncharacterized protein n=1 Tax=Pseudomonas nabeulensis TaxID=2293833 RepID=A0A4Z0B1Q6_9PSED|nr:hypothetical protein [Pseudomonas nabeulensis]TFY92976.1 hypothetical protein DYL61_16400 [Pseudomonas nabeulensis]
MSTLNEIAMNHSRMTKAKEDASTKLSERQLQVVGGFEIPAVDTKQLNSFRLSVTTQDSSLDQGAGYSL